MTEDKQNLETKVENSNPAPSDRFWQKKNIYLPVAALLALVIFMAGVSVGQSNSLGSIGLKVLNQSSGELGSVDYSTLWKALKVVSTKYVDKPVDQQKLMYGAVAGMLNALDDPHSVFFDPEENAEFMSSLNGDFSGIGAEIGKKDNKLTIVAPLPNTPAQRAGLRAQDTILQIDDQDTSGMSVDEAVNKIRGKQGTQVKLTILHLGQDKPQDITITRENIHVDSVTSETRDLNGKKVGVIKITRFSNDTKDGFLKAVNDVKGAGAAGLIIDLRSNPGGLLQSSIDLAGFWLKDNQIALKEVDAEKKESFYYARGQAQLATTPTVVLIDGGSASASEILTGALQDYKLATVVGMKSYGKGSVQDLVSLGGGSAVKITIAKWLTPNGRSIDKVGLEPDIKVDLTEDDYKNERDPQMVKALEVMGEKLK